MPTPPPPNPPVPRIQYPPPNPQRSMPPYPDNCRFFKGALIAIDPTTSQKTTVPFQYNPNTMRRSLKPNEVGSAETDRSDAVRFTGAAVETISVEVHLDAIDALAVSDNSVASYYGILPLLAALELFLYPSTADVTSYESTVASGTVNVVPPLAPSQLFVWGPNRVLPVRLASMAVTEELFDGNLNPIAATVAIEMRVLTYSDVTSDNPSYSYWMTHQQNMETMAGWVTNATHPGGTQRLIGVDVSNLQEASPTLPGGGS